MVFPPGFFGAYEEKRQKQAEKFVLGFLNPELVVKKQQTSTPKEVVFNQALRDAQIIQVTK